MRRVRRRVRLSLLALLTFVLLSPGAVGWLAPLSLFAQSQIDYTPIPTIQGTGSSSPLQGTRVNTLGLVTGITDTGFYLQDATGDDNLATSDGLFVYTRTRPAQIVGDCVAVLDATVEEFYAKTELNRAADIVASDACGTAELAPVPLPWVEPGTNAQATWEPYEGMWVQVSGEMMVHGPAKHFSSGEWEIGVTAADFLTQLGPGHLFHDTTIAGEPAAAGLIFLSNRLGAILPQANWSDRLTTTAPLRGVVDYNFGKYQLLVAPGQTIEHQPGEMEPKAPPAPMDRADEYSVCSFNLYALGRGSAQLRDAEIYAQAVRARARVIAEQLGGCTLVALQETGTPDDAAALATAIRADYGLDYVDVALPGPLSHDAEFPLTNSFIVRGDRVSVVAYDAIQTCTPQDHDIFAPGVCAAGAFPVYDRPPLVIQVQIRGAWDGPQTVWLINNHWKSKSGDETANARLRAAQADAVAAYVAGIQSADPTAQIIALGDLNDFYQGPAVGQLTAEDGPGLVELHDYVTPLTRYTYIFNGAAQVLDHVLVTPNLTDQLAGVRVIHTQADRAVSLDPAGLRVSDHDPLYVRLRPDGAAALASNVGLGDVVARVQSTDAQTNQPIQSVSDVTGEVRLWGMQPGPITLVLSPPTYAQFRPIPPEHAPSDYIMVDPAADRTGALTIALDIAPGVQYVDLPQASHRAPFAGASLALTSHALVAHLITIQSAKP